jgi:uncharacterized protein (TIGR00251 family)
MEEKTPLSPAKLYAQFQAEGTLVLRVKVIPKSAIDTIVGMLEDGTIKIRIAATPERGRANDRLCEFLAEDFGTTKDKVKILSGASDPVKLIRLTK